MKKRRRILPRAEINVTPFIDILLVLLVIFMTISPTTPAGLQTAIPQQRSSGPPPREAERVLVLSMSRTGIIHLNQMEVDLSSLVATLREIFKTRSDRTIFVQADTDLLFNDVAGLIDAAKGAGVEHIGLMTEQISRK